MNNNTQIRISAKNLGLLALNGCCKKCFWIKLHMGFKLPYSIFPGIFSSIDSYSKKITWAYFDKYKKLPPWIDMFGEYKEPVKVPHWSKFFVIDKETNLKLTGIPDDIIKKSDGTYAIIDYKTAKFTKGQDLLLPMYLVQLNGYALIAEKYGFYPVTQLSLIYYEPQTDINNDNLSSVLMDNGFNMPFKAHVLDLKLEPYGILGPLMREVREIWDMGECPKGNEGCVDCEKLRDIVGLL